MSPHILEGTLSAADHKTHVAVPFDVPPGTTRITVKVSHAPVRAPGDLFDTMICPGLEGPAGWRGMRHNNPDRTISVGAGGATPGFTPGPIEPGRWTLWLEVFRLTSSQPVTWQAEIVLSDVPEAEVIPLPAPAVRDDGPGWYRGDLHAHSDHSDARWTIADLAAFARRRELDFVTLSDHNTISGVAELERLAGDDLVPVGGVELTTHYGHALVLGTRTWQEWRARSLPGVEMPAIASRALADGKLFVIAHPMSPGDPECTGCRWEYDDMRPGVAFAVEVWNGPWSDYNEEGLAEFREWLTEAWIDHGRKLVATAGTDHHGTYHDDEPTLGFNTVHAEARSEAAILEAVALGRNVLSSGPMLLIEAFGADGEVASLGEILTVPLSEIQIMWAGLPGPAELRVVQDGAVIDQTEVGEDGSAALAAAATGRSWLMAELRGTDGTLIAVTNPVYVDA